MPFPVATMKYCLRLVGNYLPLPNYHIIRCLLIVVMNDRSYDLDTGSNVLYV